MRLTANNSSHAYAIGATLGMMAQLRGGFSWARATACPCTTARRLRRTRRLTCRVFSAGRGAARFAMAWLGAEPPFSRRLHGSNRSRQAPRFERDQRLVGDSASVQLRLGGAYIFTDYKEFKARFSAPTRDERTLGASNACTPPRHRDNLGSSHRWALTAAGLPQLLVSAGLDIFR